jgi:hypothetical protein
MSDHYVRCNNECTHMCYGWHSVHHGICQITLSDVMMNVHIWFTDTTTNTMLYVRSLCQMHWWIYTHLLMITLLTPWHDVCEIIMSDWMMNVHTCVTDTNFSCKYVYYILYNFLFSKLPILKYKWSNSLKVGLQLFFPHN